jgi:hypothetical protein
VIPRNKSTRSTITILKVWWGTYNTGKKCWSSNYFAVSTEDANLRSASSRGLVMIKKKNTKHQFFYVPVKSLVIGRLILQFQKELMCICISIPRNSSLVWGRAVAYSIYSYLVLGVYHFYNWWIGAVACNNNRSQLPARHWDVKQVEYGWHHPWPSKNWWR